MCASAGHDAVVEVRALEAAWVRQRAAGRPDSEERRELVDLDAVLDRAVGGLVEVARAAVRSLDPTTPAHQSAAAILAHCFPEGAAPITQLPYVEQREACDEVFALLAREPWKGHVEAAGLGPYVQQAAALLPRYAELVDATAPRAALTWPEVQAARARAHAAFLSAFARLLASDDPAWVEPRLAPLRAQLQALAARGRTRDTDVDPDSGAELPEGVVVPG